MFKHELNGTKDIEGKKKKEIERRMRMKHLG
jgi:hypothetical protein